MALVWDFVCSGVFAWMHLTVGCLRLDILLEVWSGFVCSLILVTCGFVCMFMAWL